MKTAKLSLFMLWRYPGRAEVSSSYS